MNVLVTGSAGFVGRNLRAALARRPDVQLVGIDRATPASERDTALAQAEVIFHLAGVNRPQSPAEFQTGNADFTREICHKLMVLGRAPKIVLSSSIQAALDNPYGSSKRAAEEALREYAGATGAAAVVFRLKNLFGKWCRPNYNSVTATFCYNTAYGLPLQISDPASVVELTYIDDVLAAFVAELSERGGGFRMADPLPSHSVTLGELAGLVASFRDSRTTLVLPDFSRSFVRALYATYLSYLPAEELAYPLEVKRDDRGSLAELIKQPHLGQLFISRTRPGITRGNHFHHTKVEKFMVLEGEAVIRLRQIEGDKIVEHRVRGDEYRVVDIAPGHTHSIENVGTGELVTLFWASEIFEPARPDTTFVPVLTQEKPA